MQHYVYFVACVFSHLGCAGGSQSILPMVVADRPIAQRLAQPLRSHLAESWPRLDVPVMGLLWVRNRRGMVSVAACNAGWPFGASKRRQRKINLCLTDQLVK